MVQVIADGHAQPDRHYQASDNNAASATAIIMKIMVGTSNTTRCHTQGQRGPRSLQEKCDVELAGGWGGDRHTLCTGVERSAEIGDVCFLDGVAFGI
jgi:hypothetical protein